MACICDPGKLYTGTPCKEFGTDTECTKIDNEKCSVLSNPAACAGEGVGANCCKWGTPPGPGPGSGCVEDCSDCTKHGTCNDDTGKCKCIDGYTGALLQDKKPTRTTRKL